MFNSEQNYMEQNSLTYIKDEGDYFSLKKLLFIIYYDLIVEVTIYL